MPCYLWRKAALRIPAWWKIFCLGLAIIATAGGGAAEIRLPGEYEPQDGLLISCRELIIQAPEVFADIVAATHARLPIIALVNDAGEYRLAKSVLENRGVPLDDVRFAEVAHDTMWARDYGPRVLSRDGEPVLLDAGYDGERARDDQVPVELARLLSLRRMELPYVIEGGNLLTNGHGLAIMTGEINDNHVETEEEQERFFATIKKVYGFNEIVILEALAGEPTGHVDMFATFTAEDSVIIGSYTVEGDAENAAILNRNAERLAGIPTGKGPLRVHRIPMPPNYDGVWRTYTNVVYANELVLVPVYPGFHDEAMDLVFKVFSRLLPGWEVIGIDASEIISSCGALHCVVMNLGPIGNLPAFPEPVRPVLERDFAAGRKFVSVDWEGQSRLQRLSH